MTPQQFMDEHGWIAIGSRTPYKVGDIDIEDDPRTEAPVGTRYVVIGELSRTEAEAILPPGYRWQPHYRFFYKALVE